MPKKNNITKIVYSRDDRPSAFQVDLKNLPQKQAPLSTKKKSGLINKFKDTSYLNEGKSDFGDDFLGPVNTLTTPSTKRSSSFFSRLSLFFVSIFAFLSRLVISLFSSILFAFRFFLYLTLRVLAPFFYILSFGKKSIFPKTDYEELSYQFRNQAIDPNSVYDVADEKKTVLKNNTFNESLATPIISKDDKPETSKLHNTKNRETEALPRDKKKLIAEFENKPSFFTLPNFQLSFLRSAVYLALIMTIVALPFKLMGYYGSVQDLGGRVLGVSEEAINNLKQAGGAVKDMDFLEAGERFERAGDNFAEAQKEIKLISSQLKILSAVLPSQKLGLVADADKVLEAGVVSSEIGRQIALIFDTFENNEEKSIKNIFNSFNSQAGPIQTNTQKLQQLLDSIDASNLDEDKRPDFELIRSKARQINESFVEMVDLLKHIEEIIGFKQDKRYLFIFQNNSEMRASGGFMGSYAIVDFSEGEIVNIEAPKGGTYDTEGAFYENIIAPAPLHLLRSSWHFWDANWWPDWKKSAKKLEWFYEHSGGSSVDGVIAITPTVVERILEIVGDLDMQESHGITITADNFWEVTQTFAEQKPKHHPAHYPFPYEVAIEESQTDTTDPGTEPKKIIGDLIFHMKEEIPGRLDKDKFLKLLLTVQGVLEEKHVLFYFNDWRLQNKFEELGWAGRTKSTAWDYLMVVNTNISGGKSDRVVEENIHLDSEIKVDGSITNTLTITRSHHGQKGDDFVGVLNLDWMRIYVPLGAEFISAKGFWPPDDSLFKNPDPLWKKDPDLANEDNFVRDRESWTKIYSEDNKTVFANWSRVEPGETVVLEIKYSLPFSLNINNTKLQAHALLVEKQAGSLNTSFTGELFINSSFETAWKYPADLDMGEQGWRIETDLDTDKFWAIKIR